MRIFNSQFIGIMYFRLQLTIIPFAINMHYGNPFAIRRGGAIIPFAINKQSVPQNLPLALSSKYLLITLVESSSGLVRIVWIPNCFISRAILAFMVIIRSATTEVYKSLTL